MKTTFTDIIENEKEKELIPFLKTLTVDDKRKLSPLIVKTIKDYQQYLNGNIRGTTQQFHLLSIAAFVCLNLKDYVRSRIDISYEDGGFIKYHAYSQSQYINNRIADEILEWYQPEWLNEFLNDEKKNIEYSYASYEELMWWHEKGYITLSPELIAMPLSRAYSETYFYVKKKILQHKYMPEKLLEYPVTLQEHIWYLFQYPSRMTSDFYYLGLSYGDSWLKVFKEFTEAGHIDRIQVLRACLQTVDYGFKRNDFRWFTKLFNSLSPAKEELLALQEELFGVIRKGEDKQLTNAVEAVKSICEETGFQAQEFVEILPQLFAYPQKTILNHVVDIADKIVKNGSVQPDTICVDICAVFLNKDEKLQKKAFRFLTTYGDITVIRSNLTAYQNSFHPGMRPAIEQYLGADIQEDTIQTVPEEVAETFSGLIREDNRIPDIQTFEDFIYYLSQVFTSTEAWSWYMLPEYLSKFRSHINAQTAIQFEPIFKTGYKMCKDEYTTSFSHFNNLYFLFLMGWLKQELKKYPDTPAYLYEAIEAATQYEIYERVSEIKFYKFHLQGVQLLFNQNEEVELLSTPTHSPVWIDPVVLVRRIKKYQDRKEIPSTADLQLAIQRCACDNTDEAIRLAVKELQGELRDLMLCVLGKDDTLPGQPEHPVWWLTAALTRKTLAAYSQVKAWGYDLPEVYFSGNYQWEIKEMKKPVNYGMGECITYNLPDYTFKKLNNTTSIYELSWGGTRNYWSSNDIYRLILSSPYNHDYLIVRTIQSGEDMKTMDSASKPPYIGSLRALLELSVPFTSMEYELISTAMLSPERTVRDLAAAVWIQQVTKPYFDNIQFSRTLAQITAKEWLPFKRFTDISIQTFQNTSKAHNVALTTCITTLIENLEIPVKGVKSLLDVYYELLQSTDQSVSNKVKIQLEGWKQHTPGLKKQVERIVNMG